jgi:hypothetical protein
VLGDALGQGFVARDQGWLDLSVIEEAIEELPFGGRERDQRLQSFGALRDKFAGPRLGIAQLARDLGAEHWDQLVFELVRFVIDVVDGDGAPVLAAHCAVTTKAVRRLVWFRSFLQSSSRVSNRSWLARRENSAASLPAASSWMLSTGICLVWAKPRARESEAPCGHSGTRNIET